MCVQCPSLRQAMSGIFICINLLLLGHIIELVVTAASLYILVVDVTHMSECHSKQEHPLLRASFDGAIYVHNCCCEHRLYFKKRLSMVSREYECST